MTEPPSRRELNKARTREAIVGALHELARAHPLSEITVDQVAEHAGISRRTFFNYYGSISAVISETFAARATELIANVDRDLVQVDPVEALRALVRGTGLPTDLVQWLAAFNCHDTEDTETSVLIQRSVWADLAGWLEGVLVQLLPTDTDPLYVSTLASGVMGTFAAAEQAWLAEVDGRSGLDGQGAIDPAAVHQFNTHLDRALGYLARGWRSHP